MTKSEFIKIDGVTPEMVANTQAKFDAWDKIITDNVLATGFPAEKRAAYRMLNDCTVYAYAFFKDPRDTKKPLKLYSYQDIIVNDTHKRISFTASNQIGKSYLLCLKAIHFMVMNPGKTVLMTSKTLPQAKDLLRQIKLILRSSTVDYTYDVGDSDTKTEIYFKHYKEETRFDEKHGKEVTDRIELPQSRIICVPATEGALGYAVDLALVDELAFYEDGAYFYKQILQPRTYTTKGQIIVFSNPNGQQGIFWDIWNDKHFHHYKFNFMDCPTNTQREFDTLSSTLTREEIDSTLLAIFTSPEGGFLTLEERKDMQEERTSSLPSIITTPIYIFFDWAKARDRTVRTIGIPIHKNDADWSDEVYVYEMKEYPQGTKYSEIIDVELKELIQTIGSNKVAIVGWDNTGVGHGLEDFVKRVEQLGIMTVPVSFNLENKSRIYTLFKLLAEQRRIKIPYVSECDKQLSMLRFKKSTGSNTIQVHHENERDRDDFPDSLSGLCSLIIAPDSPPITCEII